MPKMDKYSVPQGPLPLYSPAFCPLSIFVSFGLSHNFLYDLNLCLYSFSLTTFLYVVLNRTVNMAELRRLRRQFITYTKMHPVEDTKKIANMFVQYLNSSVK